MKSHHHSFDPQARRIPADWSRSPSNSRKAHASSAHKPASLRWIATFNAPLSRARECAQHAIENLGAQLAYRYETEEKVVIRCTLAQRQIRAELKRMDDRTTRMVVVTMQGAEVDRVTSGRVVEAVEELLDSREQRTKS